MVQNKENAFQKIGMLRPNYKNVYREVAEYLLPIWKEHKRTDLELLEYEQLYGPDKLDQERSIDYASPFAREILDSFEKLLAYEEQDVH